jgi:hypothetical protein
MQNEFSLLDTVVALTTDAEHNVLAGDLGTIVEIYTTPHLAYEVEFVAPDGSSRALLTLRPEQLRRLSAADIFTTRPAAPAL